MNYSKQMAFYKEKEVDGRDYILVVTDFFCSGCDEYHKIKFGDLLINSGILQIMSLFSFKLIGYSDFFLKYEIEYGYRKEFESSEIDNFLDYDYGDIGAEIKEIFKYSLFSK